MTWCAASSSSTTRIGLVATEPAPACSGRTQATRRQLHDRTHDPHADHIHTDTLGNVTATLHRTDHNAPTLMLFAHMDSLGFIVRKIDDDGYTRIHRLGGIPVKTLPATPVTPHGDFPGIIATIGTSATTSVATLDFVRNVTFRIDEETLRRARIRALEEGTSLNAVVEEFLETWSTRDERLARRQFVALANDHDVDGGLDEREWTRDDLYEERTRWPRS